MLHYSAFLEQNRRRNLLHQGNRLLNEFAIWTARVLYYQPLDNIGNKRKQFPILQRRKLSQSSNLSFLLGGEWLKF